MPTDLNQKRAWPLPTPKFALEPEATALIIVDMQEALCRPDKGLGSSVSETPGVGDYFFDRLKLVIPNQQRLLEAFRARKGKVIFLTVGPHSFDGSDVTAWRRRRNEELRAERGFEYANATDAAHGVISELGPTAKEVVLNKPTFGAFASTGIDHTLRNWGIRYLVVCGEATNVCVFMTAAEAADRGYECVVVEDACAAWDERFHDAFLASFALLFGRVEMTEATLRELQGKTTRQPAGSSA